ncbi:MAG: glycerol kinase [Candidatus Neomarinimicrobiota bacterium]
MKTLSTTSLSKKLNMSSQDLFKKLLDDKFIYRKEESWHLTKKGMSAGGEIVVNEKYGEFIVWPENFNPYSIDNSKQKELLNATKIGTQLGISNQRVNMIFAEIGWVEKGIKGWEITRLGGKVGGVQFDHPSGGTYVMWPDDILSNKNLLSSLGEIHDRSSSSEIKAEGKHASDETDFRSKFPATLRTKDGHMVRSRGEVIIDNALYDYGLTHAYERLLPVEEDVYCDFYIPAKKGSESVYIEYWGLEEDDKYAKRKEIKKSVYKRENFNLIELSNKHVENLDDYLPKFLLRYGIRVD